MPTERFAAANNDSLAPVMDQVGGPKELPSLEYQALVKEYKQAHNNAMEKLKELLKVHKECTQQIQAIILKLNQNEAGSKAANLSLALLRLGCIALAPIDSGLSFATTCSISAGSIINHCAYEESKVSAHETANKAFQKQSEGRSKFIAAVSKVCSLGAKIIVKDATCRRLQKGSRNWAPLIPDFATIAWLLGVKDAASKAALESLVYMVNYHPDKLINLAMDTGELSLEMGKLGFNVAKEAYVLLGPELSESLFFLYVDVISPVPVFKTIGVLSASKKVVEGTKDASTVIEIWQEYCGHWEAMEPFFKLMGHKICSFSEMK